MFIGKRSTREQVDTVGTTARWLNSIAQSPSGNPRGGIESLPVRNMKTSFRVGSSGVVSPVLNNLHVISTMSSNAINIMGQIWRSTAKLPIKTTAKVSRYTVCYPYIYMHTHG